MNSHRAWWHQRTLGILMGFALALVWLTLVSAQSPADTLMTQGKEALVNQDAAAALEAFDAALDAYQQAKDQAGEAEAYVYIAVSQIELNDHNNAFMNAGNALNLYRNILRDVGGQARALHQYARAQDALDRDNQAVSSYNQAVTAATQANDDVELAAIRVDFGDLYSGMAAYTDASEQYGEAAAVFFLLNDPLQQAQVLHKQGEAEFAQWNMDLARLHFDEAAVIFNSLLDVGGEAMAIARTGATYHHEGDFYNALVWYDRAIPLLQQAGDVFNEGRTVAAQGDVYRQLGYIELAENALADALQLHNQAGDSAGIALTETYQGDLEYTKGNYSAAGTIYKRVLALPQLETATEARAMHGYGNALMLEDRAPLRDAINQVSFALERYRNTLKDPFNTRRVFVSLAWIKYHEGVTRDTQRFLDQAVAVAREAGDVRGEIEASLELAAFQITGRNYNPAARLYDQTLQKLERLNDPVLTGRVYLASGQLKEFLTDYSAAIVDYETAAQFFSQGPEQAYTMLARVRLGRAYQAGGAQLLAYNTYQEALNTDITEILRNENLITRITGENQLYLATLYLEFQMYEAAELALDEAATQFLLIDDLENRALTATYQGDLAFIRRDNNGARSNYNEALNYLREVDERVNFGHSITYYRAKGNALLGTASILTAQGAPTLTLFEAYDAPLANYQEMRDTQGLRESNIYLAQLYIQRENFTDASSKLDTAVLVAQQGRDVRGEAIARLRLGDYYALNIINNERAAVQQYERATELFAGLGDVENAGRAYERLGSFYLSKSLTNDAIAAFTEMQALYQQSGNFVREAAALSSLAQTYEAQRRYELAAQYYNQALDLLTTKSDFDFPLVDDRLIDEQRLIIYASRTLRYVALGQYAVAENELAEVQNLELDYENELAGFLAQLANGDFALSQREALEARRTFENARDIAATILTNRELEGRACLGLARSFTIEAETEAIAQETTAPMSLQEFEAYNCALDAVRANPSRARDAALAWANAYLLRGITTSPSGQFDAIKLYNVAVDNARTARDRGGEADALLQRGDMYISLVRYNTARDDFRAAQQLFRRVDDYVGEGEASLRLASLSVLAVDYAAALSEYEQMQTLYTERGDNLRLSTTLSLIGQLYQRQTQYRQALNFHLQALQTLNNYLVDSNDFFTQALVDSTRVFILSNLGATYVELAQYEDAQTYLEEAASLTITSGNELENAIVQHLQGNLLYFSGDMRSAANLYLSIEDIYQSYGETRRLAQLYLDIGDAYYALITRAETDGDVLTDGPLAVRYYNNAFNAARRVRDQRLEASIQYRLGLAYIQVRRTTEGETNLLAALRKATDINSTVLLAGIHAGLGEQYEQTRRAREAITSYEQALTYIEEVHTEIGYETGQIAFLTQNILPYHRLVDLLISNNDPQSAFLIAERGRSRTFLFQVSNEQLAFGDDASGDLLERLQIIREERSGLQNQSEAQAGALSGQEARQLTTRIERLTNEIETLERQIATQNGLLAQVTQVDVSSIEDIQSTLTDGTVMVAYYVVPRSTVNDGTIYVFIIRSDSFAVQKLGHSGSELIGQLTTFKIERELDFASQTAIPTLYQWLIEPILPAIEGADTLIIVPHSELNNVPFGALSPDGKLFLGDQAALVYAPSATFYTRLVQQPIAERNPTSQALILGNPITLLPDLFDAEQEAQQIAEVLTAQPYVRETATEAILRDQASNVDVIHIASHGVFVSSNPLASYLALSSDFSDTTYDGALEVREIYSLSLRSRAPLVVLSACDTATANLNQGDELQSLGRAFLISGARSVVASLWQVNDAATAALMVRFYENRNAGMSDADALNEAQQYIRQQPQWSAPYYWAGFILIGRI